MLNFEDADAETHRLLAKMNKSDSMRLESRGFDVPSDLASWQKDAEMHIARDNNGFGAAVKAENFSVVLINTILSAQLTNEESMDNLLAAPTLWGYIDQVLLLHGLGCQIKNLNLPIAERMLAIRNMPKLF